MSFNRINIKFNTNPIGYQKFDLEGNEAEIGGIGLYNAVGV